MKVIKNPDEEYCQEILQALKKNGGYCPCGIEKNKDTKCKCKDFRDQIERGEAGYCHCGLWCAVSDDFEEDD